MIFRKRAATPWSEVTDKNLYLNRREFMSRTVLFTAGAALSGTGGMPARAAEKLRPSKRAKVTGEKEITSRSDATGYNNFYEFTTGKEGVAELARDFPTRPWTLSVDGLVRKKTVFDIAEIMNIFPLEERIYRFRCVEGWAMVLPWIGFPLADLIKRCEPAAKARFVKFTTLYDPRKMPGQARPILDWPYVEGLRLDEAMHPLTILSVGMYGEVLPNQNGAPIRLVVPWKYGFKSIKSIVKLSLTENQPETSWSRANPEEYGFYANVNPQVDHPRWSQARERRLGEFRKRETLLFNGYAEQVAHLYAGMDLKKYF